MSASLSDQDFSFLMQLLKLIVQIFASVPALQLFWSVLILLLFLASFVLMSVVLR